MTAPPRLYAALRANADAIKENTAQLQALRRAVAASDQLSGKTQASIAEQVKAIRTAVAKQTASAQKIAQAGKAKIVWGIGGLIIGFVLAAVFFSTAPFLQRLLG
jgi:tetrahydromethanopterin S-methyltransferase subunit F